MSCRSSLSFIGRLSGPCELHVTLPQWRHTPGTDTAARTRVTPGGQAANVAAWVAALGGRSRLISARAGDAAGTLVTGELAGRGVDVVGPSLAGNTGVVVSLSDGGSQ